MHRAAALFITGLLVILIGGCASTEEQLSAAPPVFQEQAANPPSPEPVQSIANGENAVTDEQRIDAALRQLLDVDLETETVSNQDAVIDVGIVKTSVDADRGNEVVIETCTWRSSGIRQANRTYYYRVDNELNVTLVDSRAFGSCMNPAILESAGEFAAASVDHFFNYTKDRTPTDPTLENYWHSSKLQDLQESNQRHIDGFREIRFGPPAGSGTPVAWAYNESSIELVIAVRYPYDERYGTYDTRTDMRLDERTPQIPADDLVGNDQVVEVMLWWDSREAHWRTFAMQDLYGIRCTTDDCVETINGIGPTPNRRVHQTIDFPNLDFVAIDR